MDEMDLLKELRDVPSPSPEVYDRARASLHVAMAEPVNTVVGPKRWFSWPKRSVAAAAAVAAVVTVSAAAVVMGTAGGNAPTGNATAGNAPVGNVAAGASDAAPQSGESPLAKLASGAKAAGTPSGDASLIVNTKYGQDGSPSLYYTVYTDKGQVFRGDSAASLAASVTKNDDGAQPYDAKVVEAARLAANGDLEKARIAMVTASGSNPLGVGLSPGDAEKAWAEAQARAAEDDSKGGKPVSAPRPRPTGEELEKLIGSNLRSSTMHALFVGGAHPDVRAGVLKLLSTIKEVTGGETDVDGRRALTITTSADILGGDASSVLTIDADNGLPIREEVIPAPNAPNQPRYVVDYKSARVNLADVAAGKI